MKFLKVEIMSAGKEKGDECSRNRKIGNINEK
jgi:hypothetical protein